MQPSTKQYLQRLSRSFGRSVLRSAKKFPQEMYNAAIDTPKQVAGFGQTMGDTLAIFSQNYKDAMAAGAITPDNVGDILPSTKKSAADIYSEGLATAMTIGGAGKIGNALKGQKMTMNVGKKVYPKASSQIASTRVKVPGGYNAFDEFPKGESFKTLDIARKKSLESAFYNLQKQKLRLLQSGLKETSAAVKNIIKSQKIISENLSIY